jgi:DNA-binding transcriptional ArsR family regulator
MSGPIEALRLLDRIVHEPARLAILTVLDACRDADFQLLLSATGLSPGTLSSHLSKLEGAGLIEITKSFRGKRPYTAVRVLPTGRNALRLYWQRVDDARRSADAWRRTREEPAQA